LTPTHLFSTPLEPVLLFLAALAAGTLNSVAGGGSFISFPALLFTRMPPISANATNTAALWPGTIASSIAYRKAFSPEARRLLPPLVITGLLGGLLGARILLHTPQATFMRLVPWLLLGATILFASSGRLTAWVRSRDSGKPRSRFVLVAGLLLELAIGVYIGYFGAGAGILILALLSFLGLQDIHAMNGVKTLVVSVVNGVALIAFIAARVIHWPFAVVMLAGAATGGYGGAYFAQKMNPLYIRRLVIVVGFSMSAYFFVYH